MTHETDTRIPDRRLRRYDQSLNLSYAFRAHTFVTLVGQHQFIRQDQVDDIRYLFVDVTLRHRLQGWRTDLQLAVSNIADVRTYETYSLSANQLAYNRYRLRGRMAMLKATFNL